MKKFARLFVATGLLSLLFQPVPARADPCGTILCLGGLIAGGACVGGGVGSGGPGPVPAPGCNALTADYFAIRIFTPYYNPPATAAAREAYLTAGCPFPLDQPWIPVPFITLVFGPMYDAPDFPTPVSNNPDLVPPNTPCGGPPPPPPYPGP